MKKMAICLLLTATLTTFSCKKEHQPENHNVHIDLQGWFDNDQVTVFIDGKQTFSGTATTNITLGWAGSTSSTLRSGLHTIKVMVNNNQSASRPFALNNELWIGVNLGVQKNFEFIVSKYAFNYE